MTTLIPLSLIAMSKADITIRKAVPGDGEALALIGAASFLESYAGVVDGAGIIRHCATKHTPAVYEAALADPAIDGFSGDILKSQVFFLLSHELGHVLLDHDAGVHGASSRRQELESYEFALNLFATIGTAPLGMVTWFYAARYVDPTGTAVEEATHPVFSARLRAFAERLARDADAFSFADPDPTAARKRIGYVVGELHRMARLGDDEEMLTLLPQGLLNEFPLSGLRSACVQP